MVRIRMGLAVYKGVSTCEGGAVPRLATFLILSLALVNPAEGQSSGPIEKPSVDDTFAYDQRDVLETPFFFGGAFEQFAPGFSSREDGHAARIVGGFNGQYRLLRTGKGAFARQLWLFGGFLAGVRSYCDEEVPVPGVKGLTATACDPLNVANMQNTRVVIQDATSFEASAGLRFEFLALNRDTPFPANIFAVVRANQFALDRHTSEKYSDPTVGLGFVVTGGAMRGTIFQAGRGSNSFYATPPKCDSCDAVPTVDTTWDRWKIDFTIMIGAPRNSEGPTTAADKWKDSVRFFFAVRSDFDKDRDPDSLRLGMGVTFNPSAFFGTDGSKSLLPAPR